MTQIAVQFNVLTYLKDNHFWTKPKNGYDFLPVRTAENRFRLPFFTHGEQKSNIFFPFFNFVGKQLIVQVGYSAFHKTFDKLFQ